MSRVLILLCYIKRQNACPNVITPCFWFPWMNCIDSSIYFGFFICQKSSMVNYKHGGCSYINWPVCSYLLTKQLIWAHFQKSLFSYKIIARNKLTGFPPFFSHINRNGSKETYLAQFRYPNLKIYADEKRVLIIPHFTLCAYFQTPCLLLYGGEVT